MLHKEGAASQVRTVAALRDMSHRTTALGDFCADWGSNRYEHPRSTDSNHRSLRIRHSHHNPRRSPYTTPSAAMAAATRRTPMATAASATTASASMPTTTAPMAGSKLYARTTGIFLVKDIEG